MLLLLSVLDIQFVLLLFSVLDIQFVLLLLSVLDIQFVLLLLSVLDIQFVLLLYLFWFSEKYFLCYEYSLIIINKCLQTLFFSVQISRYFVPI